MRVAYSSFLLGIYAQYTYSGATTSGFHFHHPYHGQNTSVRDHPGTTIFRIGYMTVRKANEADFVPTVG